MSKVLSDPIGEGGVSAEAARGEAVRVAGVLMAAGTALLVCLALVVCAFLDLLPWEAAIEGTAGIATLAVLFYLMVRTGLNRRFADPSLATEQTAAAILFLAYIMYHAPSARESLTLFYLVVMLYGALRLSAARLAALSCSRSRRTPRCSTSRTSATRITWTWIRRSRSSPCSW